MISLASKSLRTLIFKTFFIGFTTLFSFHLCAADARTYFFKDGDLTEAVYFSDGPLKNSIWDSGEKAQQYKDEEGKWAIAYGPQRIVVYTKAGNLYLNDGLGVDNTKGKALAKAHNLRAMTIIGDHLFLLTGQRNLWCVNLIDNRATQLNLNSSIDLRDVSEMISVGKYLVLYLNTGRIFRAKVDTVHDAVIVEDAEMLKQKWGTIAQIAALSDKKLAIRFKGYLWIKDDIADAKEAVKGKRCSFDCVVSGTHVFSGDEYRLIVIAKEKSRKWNTVKSFSMSFSHSATYGWQDGKMIEISAPVISPGIFGPDFQSALSDEGELKPSSDNNPTAEENTLGESDMPPLVRNVKEFDASKTYKILSFKAARKLAIAGIPKIKSTLEFNDEEFARWRLTPDSGFWRLDLVEGNLTLNVVGKARSRVDGTKVNIHKPLNGNSGQLWELIPNDNVPGTFFLRSKGTDLFLSSGADFNPLLDVSGPADLSISKKEEEKRADPLLWMFRENGSK